MSMNRLSIRCMLGLGLAVLVGSVAHAGTTGKLAGIVKDANSGLPLPNANVIVVGTTQGGASGEDGSFSVLNVPAGTYSVQMQTGYSGGNPVWGSATTANVPADSQVWP